MPKKRKRKLATNMPPMIDGEFVELRKTHVTREAIPKGAQEYVNLELMNLLENAYLQEPLTRKAILKRSHDVVESWLDIKTDDPRVIDLFEEFSTRVDLKNRMIELLKNSMIYGVGFLEVVVENDDAPPNEAPPKRPIVELALVSPKTIAPIWETNPKSENYGKLAYFAQWFPGMSDVVHIHPDRIVMFPFDVIGDGHRFVGIIEPMLHVIAAKIELDKASGKIPKKVISQVIAVNVDKATQKELKAWAEALKKMETTGRFVGSERVKFDIKDAGKALDIRPYSEHLIYQIAGGTGVPYTVLLGAGAGTLSTAEINLRDYYSDLKDLQVRLTPIIRRLFDWELEANGMAGAEYEIEWREIYADEQSESEILKTKADAISKLLEYGIISTDEARDILGLPPREVVEEARQKTPGVPVKNGWYYGTG